MHLRRHRGQEYMDDLALSGDELEASLFELMQVNRFLGGYRASQRAFMNLLSRRHRSALHVLDLGAGLGDVAANLVEWGEGLGVHVRVTAVEGNPAAAAAATRWLDARLPADLRARVEMRVEDVWNLQDADGSYDIVMAALFLHHFSEHEAVRLLRRMDALARDGILINDLHRHLVAYWSIRLLSQALPTSPIFRHDAPLSVLRGFRRHELEGLARRAGLNEFHISWHWAFRWTLSSL